MKAADIKIDSEYLAGLDGTSRYSVKTKCRVIGPSKASDIVQGSRASRTGQRIWEVEWLLNADRGYRGRIEAGTRSIVASTWIIRPWTAEDDENVSQAAENTAQTAKLLRRLINTFGLQESPTSRWAVVDESAPIAYARSANQPNPTFVLTAAAVEKALDAYAKAGSTEPAS